MLNYLWIKAGGVPIDIKKMTTTHIENCLGVPKGKTEPWKSRFLEELKRRKAGSANQELINELAINGYKAEFKSWNESHLADAMSYGIGAFKLCKEIEARIAISDFTGSILLAESAVLKVDRLRLLALIAKRQKQLNNSVDEELTDLIKDLYAEIDLFNVGEKIYDIVGDLLYAMPNLAIEIIEKS